jgi:hypothetical protein
MYKKTRVLLILALESPEDYTRKNINQTQGETHDA